MKMKSWMRNVLRVFPIRMVGNYVLDCLADEAKKTETDFDDKAVKVVRTIFDVAFPE
jgi:hypothetical protein